MARQAHARRNGRRSAAFYGPARHDTHLRSFSFGRGSSNRAQQNAAGQGRGFKSAQNATQMPQPRARQLLAANVHHPSVVQGRIRRLIWINRDILGRDILSGRPSLRIHEICSDRRRGGSSPLHCSPRLVARFCRDEAARAGTINPVRRTEVTLPRRDSSGAGLDRPVLRRTAARWRRSTGGPGQAPEPYLVLIEVVPGLHERPRTPTRLNRLSLVLSRHVEGQQRRRLRSGQHGFPVPAGRIRQAHRAADPAL